MSQQRRNDKFIHVVVLIFALLSLFIFSGCHSEKRSYNAVNGQLDLSRWHVDTDGSINLTGHWALYQNQLLTPSDFVNQPNGPVDYFDVPGVYKKSTSGSVLPKQGYGTLHLRVKLSEIREKPYGMITRQILSASKIWVNGQLLSHSGIVGTKSENAVESYERQLMFFTSPTDTLDIVIQTSNFDNIVGKIRNIRFGDAIEIKREYVMNVGADLFISGALFIMAIYHFALYYKRPQNYAPIYFAAFCVFAAMRNILVGGRLIYEIIPNMPFELLNKLSYLTVYSAIPFLVFYFVQLFPKDLPLKLLKWMNYLSIALSVVTLFTPVVFYDRFLPFYEIWVLSFFAMIFVIVVKATLRRDEGAEIVLVGLVVFILTVINDMILQIGIIHTRSMVAFGFFVFIFSQSYLLASQFSNAYLRIEKLVEENKGLYTDALTGIMNRRGFFEEGERRFNDAKSKQQTLVIFYGDINAFKSVNDTYGHKSGDEALITVARLLVDAFDESDLVARMSGDEFICLSNHYLDELEAKSMIERINSVFSAYSAYSDQPYELSISMGFAFYDPKVPIHFEELIHQADLMLYQHKQQYKNHLKTQDAFA